MLIMCYNLEVFVYVSIGVKKIIVFCCCCCCCCCSFFVERGEVVCIGRTSGLSGAVSDVRLKLNVLVVGMMGGGVIYPLFLGLRHARIQEFSSGGWVQVSLNLSIPPF